MTTHNHGRVSPFGHPRINAHQATPRGLTQPITSFIGLAYPGIHRAPSIQKTQNISSRTDNKKYQEQNHKKEKQTTTNNCCFFIAFASTIQFSHNTPPHTQHPTRCNPKRYHQADLVYLRGDLIEQQYLCCPRHPTACHTNKTNPNTNTFAETPPTGQPAEKASPCLCSIDPKTPHAHTTHAHTQGVSHLKNLPPPDA